MDVQTLHDRTRTFYYHRLPVFPESISDSYTSNWSTQDVLGRTSPLAAYNSTGFRSVSFDLQFHRELVFDKSYYDSKTKSSNGQAEYFGARGNGTWGVKNQTKRNKEYTHIQDIEEILRALKLACYPVYATNGLVSPTIFFRFGQFACKGFLENISYTWKPPIIDDKYMVCDVSIGPIQCSPKDVLEGSANKLLGQESMNPFGNSNDTSSNFIQQGGRK